MASTTLLDSAPAPAFDLPAPAPPAPAPPAPAPPAPAPPVGHLPIGLVSNEAIAQLYPVVSRTNRSPVKTGCQAVSDSPGREGNRASDDFDLPRRSRPSTRCPCPATAWGATTPRSQVWLTSLPLAIADVLTIVVSFGSMAVIGQWFFGSVSPLKYAGEGSLVAVAYLGVGSLMGLFPATGMNPVWELRQLSLAAAMAFGLVLLSNATLGELTPVEAVAGLAGGAMAISILPLQRSVVRQIASRQRWWGERALIIGAGRQGEAIYHHFLRGPQRGLRPVGIVGHWTELPAAAGDDDAPSDRAAETGVDDPGDGPLIYRDVLGETAHAPARGDGPIVGTIDQVDAIARDYGIRWGIVAPGGCHGVEIGELIRHCGVIPNLIMLPTHLLVPSLWASLRDCAGVMGVHIQDHLKNRWVRFLKRAFDTAGAAAGLLMLAPFFAVVAIWIRCTSPGPVFYGQTRIGGGGRLFKAWKFRTMVTDADAVLQSHLEADPELRRQWKIDHKLRNDPRIVPGIGPFLRKTSLDEIPQLWNVLRGEMSLVGPRPIVDEEICKYEESYAFYLRVRPGLTGLWQISGRNDTSYPQRVKLDNYYVCNWSIWLDLYIIVRTFRTMLLREGAY